MVGFDSRLGLLEPIDSSNEPAIDQPESVVERLAATIEHVVWRATGAAVRDLRVEIRQEQVILTGRCRTYYTKQVAQHAAMQTAGGWDLLNLIDVV
jgi:hypothetical protein